MKKNSFILLALVLAVSGVAQQAVTLSNTNDDQTFMKHMSETSHDIHHNGSIKLNTIEVEAGKKLHYAEKGNPAGTPVIFLHGLSDTWHSFENVLPLLPDDIHAFAITQRGHGASDKTFTSYRLNDFARDVATFIKKKQLKNVIVVGHSMGGIVVQQLALDYPDLLQALVIVDSDPTLKSNDGMPEFHQQVLALGDTMDRAFMDAFQKSTLFKPIDTVYYNTIVAEGMKIPMPALKAALTGLMEVDFKEQLKLIQKPVLIFWGDKDAICQRAGQDMLLKELPNAKLLVYENTCHALHWEEPQRFVSDLLPFIKTQSIRN